MHGRPQDIDDQREIGVERRSGHDKTRVRHVDLFEEEQGVPNRRALIARQRLRGRRELAA
jgi:hypothetical protein